MYESPIEITTSEIISQISKKQDEEIFEAIVKTGVNVNKEELIKALSYDRNQYSKGFEDGVKEFAERLKKRKYQSSEWSHGGHPFVVEEDDIDDVLEELQGSQCCVICGQTSGQQNQKQYDRIRNMNLDEMARFICHIQGAPCHCCGYQNKMQCQNGCSFENCLEGVKVWLESVVEDNA